MNPDASRTNSPTAIHYRGAFYVGGMPEFRKDPLAFLTKLGDLGPAVVVPFGPVKALYLRDPEGVEELLVGRMGDLNKSTRGWQVLRLFLGDGLLTNEGASWLKHRRIAQPAFHKKGLTQFAETMTASVNAYVAECADAVTRAGADGVIERDLMADMSRLTLRIAGLTLFSQDVTHEAHAVSEMLDVGLHEIEYRVRRLLVPPMWIPTRHNRRIRHVQRTMDKIVGTIVRERRAVLAAGNAPSDLLTMLMTARDEETGETMDDQQLRDEVLTLLLAGHETTATALTWTLAQISREPEVLAELLAEYERVLAGRAPTLDDLPNLEYSDRVIAESMRIYPPVWLMERGANDGIEFYGVRMNRGDMVLSSQWVSHRHPSLWPNPLKFDPSRFEKAQVLARPKYAYYPFGGGQRKCIGDGFAMMELRLLLPVLLQRFSYQLVSPAKAFEVDPTVTLRPMHGMRMWVGLRG